MSRRIFMFMRFIHLVIDRFIVSLLGNTFRQRYISISYRIKTALFPQYGSFVPTAAQIGSLPQTIVWMPPAIPGWVLDEMKALAADIDPGLYPTDEFLARCQYYSFPVLPRPGAVYRELLKSCTVDGYTHCFAIPWLKRGGADLVTLHHIETAANTFNGRVLVIMTEPGDSPWLNRLPKGVDIVDASKFVGDVSHDELLLILMRLLIQLRIDVLHIINSRHAWEIVCKYGFALSQRTHIFASIYCDDYDKHGQPVGFARQYLPHCYNRLSKVFSDNRAFPALLCSTYGYRPDLFHVLKSPVGVQSAILVNRKPQGRRVLWAGRLDRQKRPDLLLAIARELPDVEFHVYGEVVLENKSNLLNQLKQQKNVQLLGKFDGVETLPFAEFPAFLYTSQWDGTPTIVIAAALATIPMIASKVGGVADIVSEDRGYPVDQIENVALYVERILEVLDNQLKAEKKASYARDYVVQEHSTLAFNSALMAMPNYVPPAARTAAIIS
jgi:glycosyltransferase involved in cell wall biosynthesis